MERINFFLGWEFWAFALVSVFTMFRYNIVGYVFLNYKPDLSKKKIGLLIFLGYLVAVNRYMFMTKGVSVLIALSIVAVYGFFTHSSRKLTERLKCYILFFVLTLLLDMTSTFVPFFIQKRDNLSVMINAFTYEVTAYALLFAVWILKRRLPGRAEMINEKHLRAAFAAACVTYFFVTAITFLMLMYESIEDSRIQILFSLMLPSELAVCVLFVITLYYIKRLSSALNENRSYRENIEGLYETTRIFRHDYKNAMTVLSGYVRDGENEKALEFLKQYTDEAGFMDSVYVRSVSEIPDAGLKSLVISKLLAAQERGIKTSFTLSDDLKNPAVSMKIYSELVGILLDNAIEASEGARKAHINAELGNSVIHVVNSVVGEVDLNSIFERGYSTKSGHSGLGMYRFKQIVRKNDNIEYCVKSENGEFDFEVKIQE